MASDLIERLRGGKCPDCAGWGEVAYFGEMVGCTCLGRYEQPISMETRTEAADRIASLEALVKRGAECPQSGWTIWQAEARALLNRGDGNG